MPGDHVWDSGQCIYRAANPTSPELCPYPLVWLVQSYATRISTTIHLVVNFAPKMGTGKKRSVLPFGGMYDGGWGSNNYHTETIY